MTLFEKYSLTLKELDRIHVVSNDENLWILADFLDLWRHPAEIKKTLLPEINDVLCGKLAVGEIGADVVGLATIDKQQTKLEMSSVDYRDFQLPTADFKDLVIIWLDIIENDQKTRHSKPQTPRKEITVEYTYPSRQSSSSPSPWWIGFLISIFIGLFIILRLFR